jgi:hypothetical protein
MGEVGGVEELAGLLCCEVGSSSNGMPLDLPLKLPQVGIVLLRGWRRAWQVGRNFICSRLVCVLLLSVHSLVHPLIFYHYSNIPTHIANQLEKL